jgi:hypothetical protein
MKVKYQSITKSGKVIKQGKTIDSVSGLGERIIIDYKNKRYAIQGMYPTASINWENGLTDIGNIIRAQ